jgi:hypothetical protein
MLRDCSDGDMANHRTTEFYDMHYNLWEIKRVLCNDMRVSASIIHKKKLETFLASSFTNST